MTTSEIETALRNLLTACNGIQGAAQKSASEEQFGEAVSEILPDLYAAMAAASAALNRAE